ncbi:hypothetical protein XI25_04785 [Paenibacillus sp. DMB20]|nr:hypothetical protein XI25_04785 [Paenibacillus sp. DMB20]
MFPFINVISAVKIKIKKMPTFDFIQRSTNYLQFNLRLRVIPRAAAPTPKANKEMIVLRLFILPRMDVIHCIYAHHLLMNWIKPISPIRKMGNRLKTYQGRIH